eukprot:CAMPEP_0117576612 /NCGR_PEP_ID=MMETSP0784-20121206/62907_1 /TAXON_ID=39447 /ORGANISM="" /LENGTH=31 /DNA_ID= /DNA_START= /DNA_END= /DNA_ORIENTATION=
MAAPYVAIEAVQSGADSRHEAALYSATKYGV